MQTIRTYAEAYPVIANIIIFAVVAVTLLILRRFLMNRMYNRLKNTSNWYVTRKVAKWINNLMLAILFLYIFGSNLTGFTTAIGLAGAGVTYALREVIVSFAGWFAILFGDFFNTGDRVLLGSTKGDVIDIGVLRTTLMEMEEWVDGDQYTGRIVRVANSSIFTAPVYNYTADFQFLWDEIHIPLKFSSDIEYARKMLLEVADDVIGTFHEQSEKEWSEMKRRFRIENASLKPQVFVSFDDNWVKVSLRFIVGTRERRKVRDELFRTILEQIKRSENKLQLASETIEIVPSED